MSLEKRMVSSTIINKYTLERILRKIVIWEVGTLTKVSVVVTKLKIKPKEWRKQLGIAHKWNSIKKLNDAIKCLKEQVWKRALS